MSIERRRTAAGTWRFNVRVKHMGRIVTMKTFGRRADAEAWEREQYRAIQFGEFIPPTQSSKPFAAVVEEFLESRVDQVVPHTWRTDRDNLANTPGEWDSLPISAISESDILAHLTAKLTTKAHSTVSRARTTLSALFQYTVRERMRLRNPVRNVPMPAGTQEDETSEDVDAFTDVELADTLTCQCKLNAPMAEVTEFLSLTGLRWSELRADTRQPSSQPAGASLPPPTRVSRTIGRIRREGNQDEEDKAGPAHRASLRNRERSGRYTRSRRVSLRVEDWPTAARRTLPQIREMDGDISWAHHP